MILYFSSKESSELPENSCLFKHEFVEEAHHKLVTVECEQVVSTEIQANFGYRQ